MTFHPPAAAPRPPTGEEALANVSSLLAESVGRNTLAIAEACRGRLTDPAELGVVLTLARLGRATVVELCDEVATFDAAGKRPPARAIIQVSHLLERLKADGVLSRQIDERRGEVWQAVAR